MNTSASPQPSERPALARSLEIELLALDLNTCTRCVGTQANLEQALATTQQVLQMTGYEVQVRTTLIESEEQARRHHFVTSPTIRMNGHDIALETLESRCDSCTDLCGCEEGTNCRVWRYQGQEYTEAPVGMIVDALLREVYSGAQPLGASPAIPDVPENLTRFFSGKATKAAPVSSCCPPQEQTTCCAPAEKASCCGPAPSPQAGGTASCGCK
ncbi:MAG: DUF2703 domain-containing protein [Deltaproteobacteria bacterium]|nr:DUF2703 domain-containing protein [Deltaproteobacteria bacterium]